MNREQTLLLNLLKIKPMTLYEIKDELLVTDVTKLRKKLERLENRGLVKKEIVNQTVCIYKPGMEQNEG